MTTYRSLAGALLPLVLASLACGSSAVTDERADASSDAGSVNGTAGDASATSKPKDPIFATIDQTACLTKNESIYGFPADATLAVGYDYIGGYVAGNLPATLSAGTSCANAKDKAACAAALIADTSSDGWFESVQYQTQKFHVRVTHGDSVDIIRKTPADVAVAFLPIDTPREALARVAGLQKYGSSYCSEPNYKQNADRTFLVKTSRVECANRKGSWVVTYRHFALQVAADGGVTVLKDEALESAPSNQQCGE